MQNDLNKNIVQSVDRALTLLRLVGQSPEPITLQELCSVTGLNRTTVWRLLVTLESHGLIFCDPATKLYSLGVASNLLAINFRSQHEPMIRTVMPEMEQLSIKFRESVGLSIPYSFHVLTIAQLDPDLPVQLRDYTNSLSPLSCSSDGKMYLSYFDDLQLENYLANGLPNPTSHSITDPERLREELFRIRQLGYAFNEQELHGEENGVGCAITVDGRPVAFITIAGPSFRFTREIMLSAAAELVSVCKKMSRLLSRS